jgi:hypothetical protein
VDFKSKLSIAFKSRIKHSARGLNGRARAVPLPVGAAGTARKLDRLDEVKAQFSARLWLASLDVTDTPAVHKAVNEAFDPFGRILVGKRAALTLSA